MQQIASLFDHLVGADEQRQRHFDAGSFRRLQVHDAIKLGGLQGRTVRRLGTSKDACLSFPAPP
jgi:hypothetical protein